MSKRGTSTRERRIDTIIDHIRKPAFRMVALYDGSFMVSETMAHSSLVYAGASIPKDAMYFTERFRGNEKELALFVRDRKNAEALMEAIERIGSDKRRQS